MTFLNNIVIMFFNCANDLLFSLLFFACIYVNLTKKVIDPDDLSQRARWTIIATACLLLLMCLLLVGVTLRMAPIIDDMGKSFLS